MANEENVYEALAAHLDRLPAGFPRTPGGVEIRILHRLFTPEEAVTLVAKPENERCTPPTQYFETHKMIATERLPG